MDNRIIFVTGATGRQGGAVVQRLVDGLWKVRAMTRDLTSPMAARLRSLGVELVRADYDDPESLSKAMDGTYGVFSVQNFWEGGAEKEIRHGKNIVDAAVLKGVQHFVYSSVGGAERNSGVEHFETKFVVENYIREKKSRRPSSVRWDLWIIIT